MHKPDLHQTKSKKGIFSFTFCHVVIFSKPCHTLELCLHLCFAAHAQRTLSCFLNIWRNLIFWGHCLENKKSNRKHGGSVDSAITVFLTNMKNLILGCIWLFTTGLSYSWLQFFIYFNLKAKTTYGMTLFTTMHVKFRKEIFFLVTENR